MDLMLLCICIVNGLTGITTIVANSFVVLAILKTPGLHLPSNILLGSLSVSDFGVGLVVQPLFIMFFVPGMNDNPLVANLLRVFGVFFSAVSASSMMFIAIDRYLALHWHMRYQQRVTPHRTVVLLSVQWAIISLPSIPLYFYGNLANVSATVLPFTILYALTPMFCYAKIYMIIRKHRNQISAQLHALNVSPRQSRSLTTSLYIHGLYVACLIPVIISRAVYLVMGDSLWVSHTIYLALTVLYINSSLNPFIFCCRIKEIRKVVISMLKNCFRIQTNLI